MKALRARNDVLVFRLLLEHYPIKQDDLAELAGVTTPTVARVLHDLELAGFVEFVGKKPATTKNGRGRPSLIWAPARENVYRRPHDELAEYYIPWDGEPHVEKGKT